MIQPQGSSKKENNNNNNNENSLRELAIKIVQETQQVKRGMRNLGKSFEDMEKRLLESNKALDGIKNDQAENQSQVTKSEPSEQNDSGSGYQISSKH